MGKEARSARADELLGESKAAAPVRIVSSSQPISDGLAAEIEGVRADEDFRERADRLLERDTEILGRLAT